MPSYFKSDLGIDLGPQKVLQPKIAWKWKWAFSSMGIFRGPRFTPRADFNWVGLYFNLFLIGAFWIIIYKKKNLLYFQTVVGSLFGETNFSIV